MSEVTKSFHRAGAIAALRVAQAAWSTAWPYLCDWRERHDPEDPTREESLEFGSLFLKIERRINSR